MYIANDKRYDSMGNAYYMNTTFSSLYDPNVNVCGQCHGDKYRDWKAGVHGKRTGYWNGKKQYLLCVHCHNPHQPHFKPLKPMPPPTPPPAAAGR